MLYSGIDLHKRSLVMHMVGDDGTSVREEEFATTRRALRGTPPSLDSGAEDSKPRDVLAGLDDRERIAGPRG